jgi:hypothetical protein
MVSAFKVPETLRVPSLARALLLKVVVPEIQK